LRARSAALHPVLGLAISASCHAPFGLNAGLLGIGLRIGDFGRPRIAVGFLQGLHHRGALRFGFVQAPPRILQFALQILQRGRRIAGQLIRLGAVAFQSGLLPVQIA
jgi:hypothetical protein